MIKSMFQDLKNNLDMLLLGILAAISINIFVLGVCHAFAVRS